MILLEDKEIDRAYLEASLLVPDNPSELFDISRHHDRATAKAQARKFVDIIKRDYPETLFLLEDLKFWHDLQKEIE